LTAFATQGAARRVRGVKQQSVRVSAAVEPEAVARLIYGKAGTLPRCEAMGLNRRLA